MADPRLLSIVRRMGQSLKPGAKGLETGLLQHLENQPEIAGVLRKVRLPGIPPSARGSVSSEDLLQQAYMGLLERPELMNQPAAVEKLLQEYLAKMSGPLSAGEPAGLRPGGQRQGGEPMISPTATPEKFAGIPGHEELSGAMTGGRRPGVTVPGAQNILATLPSWERDILLKAAKGEKMTISEHHQLTGIQKRLGTWSPKRTQRVAARSTEIAEATPPPSPTRGVQLSPEETDRALAAYNKLFPLTQEEAIPRAPRGRGKPPSRREVKPEAAGLAGKAPLVRSREEHEGRLAQVRELMKAAATRMPGPEFDKLDAAIKRIMKGR